MNEMDEANRRDYAFKRLLDDAVESIDAVLLSPDARSTLGAKSLDALEDSRWQLREKSDHIVAVWD